MVGTGCRVADQLNDVSLVAGWNDDDIVPLSRADQNFADIVCRDPGPLGASLKYHVVQKATLTAYAVEFVVATV